MSQQKMKFRFIAFFLAAVFALSMLSLPVLAENTGRTNLQGLFDPVNKNMELDGDILIDGDTENTRVYPVQRGQTLIYTGQLDVTKIQKEINDLKEQYDALIDINDVGVNGVTSEFTATLTLPDGLSYTTGESDMNSALSENGLFKKDSAIITGQTITIKMKLKKEYTKFINLHADVTGVEHGMLTFTVPGVKVANDAKENTPLKATGTVTGNFTGRATYLIKDKSFTYNWTAVQSEAGRDAIKPADDKEITFTVIVEPAPAPEEEQDILIPCPYPCQVPPMWNPQPQPSQMIQQVQPMPQAPVQNVDAAQAPIQLPKTGEKSTQPLSLFFLLSASALFLLRRKMR